MTCIIIVNFIDIMNFKRQKRLFYSRSISFFAQTLFSSEKKKKKKKTGM